MNSSALYPPNNKFLSDKTIGDVKLSTWTRQHSSTAHVVGESMDTTPPEYSMSSERPPMLPIRAINKRSSLQRNRSRRYQARYRQTQLQMMKNLEDDIQRLQKEIKELDYRQLCASNDILTSSNVWIIALEYFRIFRHGFDESSYEQSALALDFLQKSVAPDVSDGHSRGPKALLRNWALLSFYFDDIHVELKSMENTTEDTLLATTTTSITISSNTLRLIFPHLNSDGHGGVDGGTWSQLAQRLEGQRLVMRSSVRFEWDDVNQCVVRILTWSDMLTAMLHVLGSLEDVSHAALVAPDCRLILQSESHF